jgi:peptidoglycan/LPS O-acetylase OafA/YrhL
VRSSNRQYLVSVDHLRAFAALLIVFYHAAQLFAQRLSTPQPASDWLYSTNPFAAAFYEGHTAVTLFMVLSGFIFTVGTLGHGVSFPRFMANRLLRIYPLFLVLAFVGAAFFLDTFTIGGFLETVFGFANMPGAMEMGTVGGMFWAVAVEVQFYLIFPLLNRLLNRYGVSALFRLLAAIVLIRALGWAASGTHDVFLMLYKTIAGRIDDFLLGMIAAWFYVNHQKRFRGWWKVLVCLGLAITMLWAFNQVNGFWQNRPWRLAWIDVEAGVWALFVVTYVSTVRSRNLVSRAGAKIGELSYSIYLLHYMMILIVSKQFWYVTVSGFTPVENALLTSVAVLLPLVLVSSAVTYYGVELPFLRMRVKYLVPLEASTSGDTVRSGEPGPEPGQPSDPAPRHRREPGPAVATVPAARRPADPLGELDGRPDGQPDSRSDQADPELAGARPLPVD